MKKQEKNSSYIEYSRRKQAVKDAIQLRHLEQKSNYKPLIIDPETLKTTKPIRFDLDSDFNFYF